MPTTTSIVRRPKADKICQMVAEIMRQLDTWVSSHGNGQYVSKTFVPLDESFMIPEEVGIQQNREEIEAFVSVLLSRAQRSITLEIGLGSTGGTHFLWRLLFDRVITIEKSHERVRAFGTNLRAFHKRWVLDDHRSSFLIGSSHDPETIQKAYHCAKGGVDLLFIDGDHRYTSVLADWLLYNPLVRKGGLVVFHDVMATINNYYGVPTFIEKLSKGEIDGQPRQLSTIIYSKSLGLAYYEK